jgi:hypothetical protein
MRTSGDGNRLVETVGQEIMKYTVGVETLQFATLYLHALLLVSVNAYAPKTSR